MQIFNIIIGVLAMFCGIYNIFWPEESFLNAGWFLALILLLWGICAIVTYSIDKKQRGDKDNYNASTGATGLVFGIFAVVASILALFIESVENLFLVIILIVFMAFLLVNGIQSIMRGVSLRKTMDKKRWILPIVLGILQLVAAVIGIGNWIFTAGLISLLFGIMMLFFGLSLFVAAFCPDPIDRFKEY